MLHSPTAEVENPEENAVISTEIPEIAQPKREITKQFPLRLPVSVINDLENEVKNRRSRGEMIETPMYCRFILENHRKVSLFDAEIQKLRDENASLTQRLLEYQLHGESDADTEPKTADDQRAYKALQIAVKKASETIAESSYNTAEYYETLVSEYFRQILPQIP